MLKAMRRHHAAVQGVADLTHIAMGVLVLTGELTRLDIEAQRFLPEAGLDFLYNL